MVPTAYPSQYCKLSCPDLSLLPYAIESIGLDRCAWPGIRPLAVELVWHIDMQDQIQVLIFL